MVTLIYFITHNTINDLLIYPFTPLSLLINFFNLYPLALLLCLLVLICAHWKLYNQEKFNDLCVEVHMAIKLWTWKENSKQLLLQNMPTLIRQFPLPQWIGMILALQRTGFSIPSHRLQRASSTSWKRAGRCECSLAVSQHERP